MSKLNSSKVYKVSDLIVSKKDSDGVNMLVSMDESDSFFRIDGMASIAWDMLKEGKSLGDITQGLHAQYPKHKDRVDQDLEAFINKLLELKILEE